MENGHPFCCTGCSQVYLLLNETNLCGYYDMDKNPGIKAKGKFVSSRFAYLEDETIIDKLAQFRSAEQVNVTFSLPQMHCSSCIYLLENLSRLESGIISSHAHFERKEVFVSFNPALISLRKLVELLAFIGYEPAISLENADKAKPSSFNRARIIELGVAGFCFSNIMMLSFPEYFSGGEIEQEGLKATFTWIIFVLSIPVIFYSARSIFISAWKGLRQGIINIDAPIALASTITFARSYYEIISGTGVGYLDSGTGIIFFMLIGRWFQAKTYDAISFDRQYRSYFPLGVTVLRDHREENIPVTKLQKGETIIVRNEEMIPADAVLLEGNANIDYSFVSGENIPVPKKAGALLYAGGKQQGTALLLKVVKQPSQSYITQLWNNDVFGNAKHTKDSFIHPWSRYFTVVLFSIASVAGLYWFVNDASKLWTVVTAVLIVACPCSLLLSATFTFGNMLRIFGKNKLYLKNASVIESLSVVDHLVLDKTGTLTESGKAEVRFTGKELSPWEESLVKTAASQSSHTLSHSLSGYLHSAGKLSVPHLQDFTEIPGKGLRATMDNTPVQLGSASFVAPQEDTGATNNSCVYVRINNNYKGFYEISNTYRQGMAASVDQLSEHGYKLHLLSGDNDAEKNNLYTLLGKQVPLNFNVSPQDKLDYIKMLQGKEARVLMVGDGLNDAGALMQANCGIAVSDDAGRFSPACDAIIDGKSLSKLSNFLSYARAGKTIVMASFILSILYNVIGISFAVQGKLSPLVAAILMPASSISIVIFVSILTSWVARRKGL
jgi:Cu+-exporting ATPase